MSLRTVHVVFNAHIDPIWLWPWSAGLDEIVGTCESVCSVLERNPDVFFTRGEAWVYEQIEAIDPALFRRIRRLVRGGQWCVVGGWYVQPDCNIPGAAGFRKQIEIGQAYFRRTFGRAPKIAYNVDSFGHAATIPNFLSEAGQTHYVFLRPQEHEKVLPSRLFRWRSTPRGPSVTAFRIAGMYHTSTGLGLERVEASLSELPPGVTDTMCFAGVGDHGGGPTEELIEWCRAHRDAVKGARLEFSTPERFFRAVAAHTPRLPVVTGELQRNSIGCYSVHRRVKVGVRRAEALLSQAETALARDPGLRGHRAELDRAWRWLCFSEFHDTLGGTCIPSAYPQVDAHLGWAQAAGDEVVHLALRRAARKLAPDRRQRLVIGNFSGRDFSGWIEHEPWLDWTRWQPGWCLLDERGREVPHQRLEPEAMFRSTHSITRLLFRLSVPAKGVRVLRIAARAGAGPSLSAREVKLVRAAKGGLGLGHGPGRTLAPRLELVEDRTDTWGHHVEGYSGPVVGLATWGAPKRVESGFLLTAWRLEGRIGSSRLVAELRGYRGERFWEMRLEVDWRERHRALRLVVPTPSAIRKTLDGIPGGETARPPDGRESPLRDRVLARLSGGSALGIVAPGVFSVSSVPDAVRLTLLRSPLMGHHVLHVGRPVRRVFADQERHPFVFRFFPDGGAGGALLDREALGLQAPPLISDVTRGMPFRALEGKLDRPL